jgi:preprotein translocase subunit SecG
MLVLALSGSVFSFGMMIFLLICLALVLAIMIQKPQGGGLSAAFGASSGSGQTAFGTKTGDALTVATILVFVVWLLLAMVLNIVSRPSDPVAAPPTVEGTSAPGDAPTPTPPVNAETPVPQPTPAPGEPQNPGAAPTPSPSPSPAPESTPR